MMRPARSAGIAAAALCAAAITGCHRNRSAAAAEQACAPVAEAQPPGQMDVAQLPGSYDITFVASAGPRSGHSVRATLVLRRQDSALVALPPRADQAVITQPVIGWLEIAPESLGAVRMGDPRSENPSLPGVGIYVTTSQGGSVTAVTGRVGSGSNARGIEAYDGGYFALYLRRVTSSGVWGGWQSGGAGGEPPQTASGHFCATRPAAG